MKRYQASPENCFYPPYARDIRNLLVLYYKRQRQILEDQGKEEMHKLSSFLEVWDDMLFSVIHRCCPSEISYVEFLREVFTACVGYLDVRAEIPFTLKVGVIYLLYCLYITQKDKSGISKFSISKFYKLRNSNGAFFSYKSIKELDALRSTMLKRIFSESKSEILGYRSVPIDMSIDLFKEVNKLRKECIQRKAINCYQVIVYFLQNHCFNFVPVLEIDKNISSLFTPFLQERNIGSESLVLNTVNIDSLRSATEEYLEAKNDIFDNEEEGEEEEFNYYNIVNMKYVDKISEIMDSYGSKKEDRENGNKLFQLDCEKKVIDSVSILGSKKDVKIFPRNRIRKHGVEETGKMEPTMMSTMINLLPYEDVNGVKVESKEEEDNKMLGIIKLENDFYSKTVNNNPIELDDEELLSFRPYGPFKHLQFAMKIEKQEEEESEEVSPIQHQSFVAVRSFDGINSIDDQTNIANFVLNRCQLKSDEIVIDDSTGPVQNDLIQDHFRRSKKKFGEDLKPKSKMAKDIARGKLDFLKAKKNGDINGLLELNKIPQVKKSEKVARRKRKGHFEFSPKNSKKPKFPAIKINCPSPSVVIGKTIKGPPYKRRKIWDSGEVGEEEVVVDDDDSEGTRRRKPAERPNQKRKSE